MKTYVVVGLGRFGQSIACRLCEKTCEHDAIHVEDNVAHINKDLCVECGACATKCPKHVIL